MLRRVLSKCNLSSPKTLSQEQQACFFSTSAIDQHQLVQQQQPQPQPLQSGMPTTSTTSVTPTAQQEFSSTKSRMNNPSPTSSSPMSNNNNGNNNRSIRSPSSSSPSSIEMNNFNSLGRLQKQQQFDTSGNKVSATATATTSSHPEHQVWRIMGQLYSNRVNFFNDTEVQQKVSEACSKAFPNSEEQRRELESKILDRIEEKKDIMDPYRRPYLYV